MLIHHKANEKKTTIPTKHQQNNHAEKRQINYVVSITFELQPVNC